MEDEGRSTDVQSQTWSWGSPSKNRYFMLEEYNDDNLIFIKDFNKFDSIPNMFTRKII